MAQPLRTLPLFSGGSPPPPLPDGPRTPRQDLLWVAVHLPALPLEVLSGVDDQTTVVVEPHRGPHRVIAANAKALAHGIAPGLKVSAALALSRELMVLDRSPEAERRELASLALWARRITPSVSLEPPQALLLEVRGSLKLWGGTKGIKRALIVETRRRRLTAHLCVAPTALAALWLARYRQGDVPSHEELVGRLGSLPLTVTGWSDNTRLRLRKMGIKTIGDCLRLPRDGLARRVGRECLSDLDKVLGQTDLRPEFQPARRLSALVEFPDEVTEPGIIEDAGQGLIGRLARALQKRQVQIGSFEIGFHHQRRPKTKARVNLVTPTHEREKISRLFVGKLETISLPAPVIAVSLTTGPVEPLIGQHAALFSARTVAVSRAAMGDLIERLRLRFGTEEIYGLALIEEHRPEAAWAKTLDPLRQDAERVAADDSQTQRRPLWILPAPMPLPGAKGGAPQDRERRVLRLESGPERIEAGWWEGRDISRDYYVARNQKGERLWIYRDRCSDRSGWYLHGIFG